MGRKPDPKIKADLLEQIVAYILKNGLQDLSLRPMAEALGTNPRMLLYHFASKENLIVEAVGRIQPQQQGLFAQSKITSAEEGLRLMWRSFTSSQMAPFLRLTYEIEVLAIQSKPEYQRFAQETLQGWINLLLKLVPGSKAAGATLVVGAFEGLLLDWLVSGDRERVEAGFEALLEVLKKAEVL